MYSVDRIVHFTHISSSIVIVGANLSEPHTSKSAV